MSTTTTNYSLVKPVVSENYDIAIPNSNMDLIDLALTGLNTSDVQMKGTNIDLVKNYSENVVQLFDGTETYASNSWAGTTGTYAADLVNFKTTEKAAKITTSTNNGGIKITKTKDCSLYPDGSAVGATDYIRFAVESDTTSIGNMPTAGMLIRLCCDAATTITNCYTTAIAKATFSNGVFVFVDVAISALTSVGSPSLANVKGLSFEVNGNAGGAITATIDVGSICIVRKDPSSSVPNPFQYKANNIATRLLAINAGTWFLGYEFGRLVSRDINGAVLLNQLQGTVAYTDFAINANISAYVVSYTQGAGWYQDANNNIKLYIWNNILTLRLIQAGVTTNFTLACTVAINNFINLRIVKSGSTINAIATVNGTVYSLSATTTITGTGYLTLGNQVSATISTNWYNASISTLAHADHSSKSDWAAKVGLGTWEVIEKKTLSANAAQVDFTTIDSAYKQLMLIMDVSSSSATVRDIYLRVNDNSASNKYLYQFIKGTGTTLSTDGALSTHILLEKALTQQGSGVSNHVVCFINNISGLRPKVNINYGSYTDNVLYLYQMFGEYNDTISLNKINLIASGDNIKSGSQFILMGVK
jgi:hypothetical protein